MRPAETIALACESGCRVVAPPLGAGSAAVVQLDCPDGWAAARFLLALARADVNDPSVRALRARLLAGAVDDETFARRAHFFVQRRIRFERERGEVFQAPAITLARGAGDCDCQARLLFAVLAPRVPTRLAFLYKGGGPRHVIVQARVGGRWQWLETTVRQEQNARGVDALFGEHPVSAARRAGIIRDDVGADMKVRTMGGPTTLEQNTICALRFGLLIQQDAADPSDAVARALDTMGFRNANVAFDPKEMPAEVPELLRGEADGCGTVWAVATYVGAARDVTLPLRIEGEVPIMLDDVAIVAEAPPDTLPETIGDAAPAPDQSTPAGVLAAGWETLSDALVSLGFNVPDVAKPLLLGIAWGESRLGSTPDWGTSNNWGAVTYTTKDPTLAAWGFIAHADHDANGKPVTYRFQAYPSQLEGARGFLRVIMRGGVPAALLSGSARDLAAAMYANHYYTGTSGTADDRISAYASMIESGANYVRAQLGKEPKTGIVAKAGLVSFLFLAGTLWYTLRT